MSIKEEAIKLVEQLPEEASWNDLVKSLIRDRKVTLGLTDIEVVQDQLTEEELSAVIARLESASSAQDDMRNTRKYNPDDALTISWVLVSLAPLLFISILIAPAAYLLSALGIVFGAKACMSKVNGAWLPTVVGVIELILFVALPAAVG
ncbi:hypothetical protein [Hydrogenovibrio marinus]|uniref:hypothetical protein n=1 Tax=Hydrogenovibrio marinus TaxID=28885 RepID=UPI000ABD4417|nr:hypothetical protein [Hydrogenovibrio marinus]BBN59621.1 hypothetical protein HVMH_1215 [Hydrogenovibrio marinus]